jgi:EpsI family protein
MSELRHRSSTALALIAAAGILVGVLGSRPTPPPPPSLVHVPLVIAGWTGHERSSAGPLTPDPQALRHLVRIYERDDRITWLAVDYYADQVEGQRAVARHLVFPPSGVNEVTERVVRLDSVTANLVSMRRGADRFATVYWYQLPGHAVAGDHWYRALLLWRRLAHGRADGALVRVAFPVPDGTAAEAALDTRADLLRALAAELTRRLPS